MNFLAAVILGIVEGATEFLPVSSTGHLILAGRLLHIPHTNFAKSFDITIQFGAILAVVFLYWNKLGDLEIWKRLAIGFLPTAAMGFALYETIKTYLLGSTVVVVFSLMIGRNSSITFCRSAFGSAPPRRRIAIADLRIRGSECSASACF